MVAAGLEGPNPSFVPDRATVGSAGHLPTVERRCRRPDGLEREERYRNERGNKETGDDIHRAILRRRLSSAQHSTVLREPLTGPPGQIDIFLKIGSGTERMIAMM